MQGQVGICPGCGSEGDIGTSCPGRMCRPRGTHRIPAKYFREGARIEPELGLLLDGRYLLVRLLGEGGFGRVFTALQLPIGMVVALKVLKKDGDADTHARRMMEFRKEAETMARLKHPNIVQLLDFGFFEGAAYLVTELISEARTLKDEVRARAKAGEDLGLSDVEAILSGVLHGLEEAHDHGVVHRDIKPENIMLQRKPGHPFLPRILDFGLAKSLDSETQSSVIMGTVAYMAPEQLKKRDLGPWTDLYALGIVAYELMTGRRPFAGEVAQILADKRNPSYDVLGALADLDVPGPIAEFLRQALDFEPASRFRTAHAFRVAMQAAFRAASESARHELLSIDLTTLARDGTSDVVRGDGGRSLSDSVSPLSAVIEPEVGETRAVSTAEVLAAPIPKRAEHAGVASASVHSSVRAARAAPASMPPRSLPSVPRDVDPPASSVAVSTRPNRAAQSASSSEPHTSTDEVGAGGSRKGLYLGLGAGAAGLVTLIAVLASGAESPPRPVQQGGVSPESEEVMAGPVPTVQAELPPCPIGKERGPDSAGECCWPGQVWASASGRCVGIPRSCPEGREVSGETCAEKPTAAALPRSQAGGGGASVSVGAPAGYVEIPAGVFMMGSTPTEEGRNSDETQHEVRITRPFWLKTTEVTQGEWEAVMGSNPSRFKACGSNCPVEKVSWIDAVAYLNELSAREGLESCYGGDGSFRGLGCPGYRLPTEAEWEYAARAGKAGEPAEELDLVAWYDRNSVVKTHPTGSKDSNAWGLYDMLGNVWEWVHDKYGPYGGAETDPVGPSSGSRRVLRGGSWGNSASYVRAAVRAGDSPAKRNDNVGLRPARSIP